MPRDTNKPMVNRIEDISFLVMPGDDGLCAECDMADEVDEDAGLLDIDFGQRFLTTRYHNNHSRIGDDLFFGNREEHKEIFSGGQPEVHDVMKNGNSVGISPQASFIRVKKVANNFGIYINDKHRGRR